MSDKANNHPDLLLVDDDKSLLRLLTIRLEGEGYNVCLLYTSPSPRDS